MYGWADRPISSTIESIVGNCLLGALLWIPSLLLTQRVGWVLPGNCRTVGGLVNVVVARNYGALADAAGGWNEKEIWMAWRELIADETGVDKAIIDRSTPFPEGLNIS